MPRASTKSYFRSKRSERKRNLIPEVSPLLEDAPLGTYLVDSVAEKLHSVEARDESAREFTAIVRHALYFAASISRIHAENYYVNEPRRLLKTRRLFSDFMKIKSLIERNKGFDKTDVILSTKLLPSKKPYVKGEPDEFDKLMTFYPA